MSDLFEFNGAEGAGWSQPEPSLGGQEAWSTVPEPLRRESPPVWPRASEPELVRHYTWLSSRNFGIDTGFYPLGSCTCLLYTSPSPRDRSLSRMPSSA